MVATDSRGVEESSVSSDALGRAAAYLDSWRALAMSDPKALFKAFSEATQAADWVLGQHPKQLQMAARLVGDDRADVTLVQTRGDIGLTGLP